MSGSIKKKKKQEENKYMSLLRGIRTVENIGKCILESCKQKRKILV